MGGIRDAVFRVSREVELSTLGRLVPVDLRENFRSEDREFTPWLADNIDILGEVLDIGIESKPDTEVRVGSFFADIVGQQVGSEYRILIENQLEETDNKHLGQIIAYAAGLEDIKTVVWIAKSFREEHRAAMDWLNSISGSDLRFFGVEIELVRIGESDPAPHFKLVCQPNDWSRNARARRTQGQFRRCSFWSGVLEQLESTAGPCPVSTGVSRDQRQWFGLDCTGISLQGRVTKGESWVEIAIGGKGLKPELAEERFRKLESQKEDIESEVDSELNWHLQPDRQAGWISLRWPDSCGWDDESKWDTQHARMARSLHKMYKAFQPRVGSL